MITDTPRRFPDKPVDLLIVGGGIHGAFAAWDAALRGLDVALIERGDFGGGTSANSLKIVHGGLRYLQHGDLSRIWVSIRERGYLMRAAPHLVKPLAVVVPSSGRGARSRAALGAALKLNDLIASVQNRSPHSGGTLPRGRLISREELRRAGGAFCADAQEGGALWYDAILESPERVLIEVLRAAVAAGATVLNYAEARTVTLEGSRVRGARVRDHIGGAELHLAAEVVLNAAGPWAGSLAGTVLGAVVEPAQARGFPPLARACNLVLARSGPPAAVAIPHPIERRFLFAVPWRGHLMLGTSYTPHEGPLDVVPRKEDVRGLLEPVNAALPGLRLRPDEVKLVHRGLLPACEGRTEAGATPVLRRDPLLIDHARADGVRGLVSLVATKWTTARHVAERAVDICQRALGVASGASSTLERSLQGSDLNDAPATSGRESAAMDGLSPSTVDRLNQFYGAASGEILAMARDCPELAVPVAPNSPVLAAEVVHAIRHEWARHLTDVVLRRTELGTAGHPDEAVISGVARVAGRELGWTPQLLAEELDQLEATYRVHA